MKKHLFIASIILTCLFDLKSNAQSFQLLDTTGAQHGGAGSVAQTTYNFTVDTSASGSFLFNIKNLTSSAITIKIKKRVISNSGIDAISFCVGTTCYTPLTTISGAVSIPANSLLGSGFLTDFTATNTPNTASVVYTIINTANTDSVYAFINYNVSNTAGIKQIANNYSISNIAPNPASSDISLSYDLKNSTQSASIKIYNMLGALVKTVPLETYTNNTKIDINSLEEGIYIYSVVIGGKAIKTNRLVVSR